MVALFNATAAAGYNVSLINVDFPEPETPVIHVNTPMGIFRLTDCKLFPVAASTDSILPLPACLFFGISMDRTPDRN